MVFIENTGSRAYTIECMGSHRQNVKLNFDDVEGIEFNARSGFESRHAFLQMAEGDSKVLNIRFCYPVRLRISFMGKIMIDLE